MEVQRSFKSVQAHHATSTVNHVFASVFVAFSTSSKCNRKIEIMPQVAGNCSSNSTLISDIIAFDTKKQDAYITNPTVRYETNNREKDAEFF